jgi:hypothetical protein
MAETALGDQLSADPPGGCSIGCRKDRSWRPEGMTVDDRPTRTTG